MRKLGTLRTHNILSNGTLNMLGISELTVSDWLAEVKRIHGKGKMERCLEVIRSINGQMDNHMSDLSMGHAEILARANGTVLTV